MERVLFQAAIAALTGGLIGGVIQIIFWYAFTRREQRRDQEVHDLKAEVRTLRDDNLVKLDQRLTADHAAHGHLHDKINHLSETFVTRRECALACGPAIEQIRSTQSSQAAAIRELSDGVVATRTIVELIADRMNISIGALTHESRGANPG